MRLSKKGSFAGQFRIDRIGTFMRGAPPFARRHVEAQTRDFVAVADIIEIAANGQIAVATDADKALDQLLDIAAFPVIELRRGDFGQA